ncbi:MAG: acyltransferase [Marinilabiliales bacterium]|nr:MAG: acyltransferase [Marinilabiliales bacterium]
MGISKLVLKLLGWKQVGDFPDVDRAIIVVAPHTSLFDFAVGRLYLWSMKKKVYYFIKGLYFWFPLGLFLKAMGGIPVPVKSSSRNLITFSVREFKKRKQFFLIVTPEGTRSATTKWKHGFYYIAQKGNIPVYLGYLDYSKKHIGLGPELEITGNIQADMEKLKRFYIGKNGKHPERFITGYENDEKAQS